MNKSFLKIAYKTQRKHDFCKELQNVVE